MSSIFNEIITLLSFIDFTFPPANELLAISGAINGVTAAAVGIAILFGGHGQKVSVRFFLLMMAMMVWGAGYYFWLMANSQESAHIWINILNIGSLAIPALYYHWICTFFGIQNQRKTIIRIFYFITLLLIPIIFTSAYIKSIGPIEGFYENFHFWPRAGMTYPIYVIGLYGGSFVVSIIDLFLLRLNIIRNQHPRQVILLFIVVTLFSGALGATNFFLWFGVPVAPWTNFLVVLQIILFTYAVYRYHVVHARQVVASFTVTLIVIVLVIDLVSSREVVDILYRCIILIIMLYFARIMLHIFDEEVSERERIEKLSKQLNIVNERLVRLDKAKSDMLSIAAHQLRTPLTAMNGYLSLILDGVVQESLGAKTQEMLTKVSRATARLGALVNNLLNMSRIDDGRMQYAMRPINIENIIRETAETFDILVQEKGLHFMVDIPKKTLPMVSIDDNKIHEVISNLINNAIKYTKEGGITVRVWQHDEAHVRFSVRDTGVGIPDDVASKLFSKFSRADKQQLNTEGAGIGLYVAYNIVRDHGGHIWAESDGEGKGSEFIVELKVGGKV